MKITLTNEGISKAIEKINNLNEEVTDIALNRVVKQLVRIGTDIANDYTIGAPQSNEEPSVIISGLLENGKAGYIALRGEGAVYEEFGTGEEGANDPHPMKNNFPLNPYNSGPTIRYDEFDRPYWIYKPMAGQPYFDEYGKTHGIPSGKMIYNASKHLRSVKDNIIKTEFENVLKKFK